VAVLASYDERLAGLLAIGMPKSIASVVAFRPELVAELGTAANIAMNPASFALEQTAIKQGLPESKNPVRTRQKNAYGKALSKALVNQNAKQRKKNGSYKKGKSAATVLKAAHKEARRMVKK
tara:strand:- start:200 stop:565 length:366 start_codon:yes stop_codon:yes gene_type:complete